jgi:hypothetical protein
MVPVVIYLATFGGLRRTGLALASVLAFAATVAPWLARNLAVSGTLFGTAGYAVMEGTGAFPGTKLMQSLNPNLEDANYFLTTIYPVKFLQNLRSIYQGEFFQLGGGLICVLFLAGLLLGLRNNMARRLRYFTMLCLGVFILVSALGRTQWTLISPEMNTENPLVLLTPLVAIFGVAFFLTLLNQMNLPSFQARLSVVGLVAVLLCQPMIMSLLPPRTSPIAYPPYYPPEIQKIGGWIQPEELVMSDIPWAVAWYGDRQCTWTTLNAQYEFIALNDFIKPVNALYLTLYTLDGKLFTECIQGGVGNWSNFAYKTVAFNQLPSNFPLVNFPLESLSSGLFLSDRQRW